MGKIEGMIQFERLNNCFLSSLFPDENEQSEGNHVEPLSDMMFGKSDPFSEFSFSLNDENLESRSLEKVLKNVAAELISQFETLGKTIDSLANEALENIGEQMEEYENLMYSGVAFLVVYYSSFEKVTEESSWSEEAKKILYHICWSSSKLYCERLVRCSIFCWEWLLSEIQTQSFKILLLLNIKESWNWSIKNNWGLFSKLARPLSPLFSENDEQESGNEKANLDQTSISFNKKNNSEPHKFILNFLQTHFLVVENSIYIQQQKIIFSILQNSLSNVGGLNKQPNSISTRFTLLSFAFKFIRARNNFISLENEKLLRKKIYLCAFNWFSEDMAWHIETKDTNVASDLSLLINFCKQIEIDESYYGSCFLEEENEEKKPEHIFLPTTSIQSVQKTFKSDFSSSPNSISHHFFSNSDLEYQNANPVSSQPNNSPQRNLLFSSSKKTSSPPTQRRNTKTRNPVIQLSKTAKLLQMLVGHEIDCIIAISNPQKKASLKIENQELYSFEKYSKMKVEEWISLAEESIKIDPKLLIAITQRFPNKLNKFTSEKVKKFPHMFIKIPSSILYFVTPELASQNSSQLSLLQYWTNEIDPTTALHLLSEPFQSNIRVTQYVVGVLNKLSIETVTFYLPQLVQTLRFDKTGFVRQFLLEKSLEYPKFCHQLIWNLQNYSDNPEDNKNISERHRKDTKTIDPLISIATGLKETIIESFSEEQMKQYRVLFDFFGEVTGVSGKLTGLQFDDRRPVLIKNLKNIILVKDAYLPTNPNLYITKILCDSSSPMQSAAKTPILVPFVVKQIDEVVLSSTNNTGKKTLFLSVLEPTLFSKQSAFKKGFIFFILFKSI